MFLRVLSPKLQNFGWRHYILRYLIPWLGFAFQSPVIFYILWDTDVGTIFVVFRGNNSLVPSHGCDAKSNQNFRKNAKLALAAAEFWILHPCTLDAAILVPK